MTGVPFMNGPFSLPSKEAKEAEKKKRVRAMPSPAPLARRSRARPIRATSFLAEILSPRAQR
jgi:hypothetical protein